ncbi:hypothetical protein ANRL4_00980 [Anaerolineae bacterium]|nr:hypothetical protein ANRL4_00980 [Anaerolineae bacterium]
MQNGLLIGFLIGIFVLVMSMLILPKLRPGISDQDRAYISIGIASVATIIVAILAGRPT